eukprot:200900-Chlamydomonas_euryale.AAC.1
MEVFHPNHVRAFACACTGGVLIMEVFHPNQVAKGYRAKSGGPPDPTMMYMLVVSNQRCGRALSESQGAIRAAGRCRSHRA